MDIDTHSRAGIGHNQPPSLRDELAERHSSVVNRCNDLIDAAEERLVEVKDDTSAAAVADFAEQCKTALGALNEAHKVEKKPWLDGSRVVDGYFKGPRDELETIVSKIKLAVQRYANAKLAEQRKLQAEADKARREAAPPDTPDLDTKAGKPVARMRGQVGSISARAQMQWRCVDWSKVDLNCLRNFLTVEDIAPAMNRAVKAGLTEMAGMEIYEGVAVRV